MLAKTLFLSALVLNVSILHQAAAKSTRTCEGQSDPTACLAVANSFGEAECTWLMLKGRCTDAGGREGKNSPTNCCASRSEESACLYRSANLTDGMCAISDISEKAALLRSSSVAPSMADLQRLAHISFAVYCSESQVNSWSCGEHCSPVSGLSEIQYVFDSSYHVAAFVAWDSVAERVLVTFRGTVNSDYKTAFNNWVTNLDFFKTSPITEHPNVEIHKGFWSAYQALKPDIVPLVRKVMASHSTTSVQVTGHSLGAAMATLASIDLRLEFGWSTSLVNFGSPRVGDYEFHRLVSEQVPVWRVTHDEDMVVHVPPSAFGFYHASTELYFGSESGLHYKVCDGSGEDASCANSCTSYLPCTSISDHLNYLDLTMTCSDEAVIV